MANKKNIVRRIKSAVISVSDKSNLKPLLQTLNRYNVKLISSGGTFKAIRKLGYRCLEVSDYTGFMYLGRLAEFGKTDEIFSNPKEELTERYITGRFG